MSTLTDFGIANVGRGILHPRHRDRFNLIFANLGGGVDSQPVSMQVTKTNRPNLSFDEVQLDRYNSRAWVAGKSTWSELNVTIQDDISGTASNVIQAQLQKQKWLIGAEGQWLATAAEGSLYKFVAYLNQLDGNDQTLETWVLEGCWIKSCNWGENDYSTADPIEIELVIRYDNARQLINGYNDGPGSALGGSSISL